MNLFELTISSLTRVNHKETWYYHCVDIGCFITYNHYQAPMLCLFSGLWQDTKRQRRLCTHRQCFAKPHAVRQDAALTWVLSVTQLVHRLHHVVPHKLYRCMSETTNHMNSTAVRHNKLWIRHQNAMLLPTQNFSSKWMNFWSHRRTDEVSVSWSIADWRRLEEPWLCFCRRLSSL